MKHNLTFALALAAALSVACKEDDISGSIDVDFEMDATDVFTGDTLQFRALTDGVVARYDWWFEGGVPETSPLSAPSVHWQGAGNYTVTLSVSNKNGSAVATKRKVITVDWSREISADFSVDRESATNDDYIQFTDMSTGSPSAWLWTFTSDSGERVTSTDRNPLIRLEPGTWTVMLKVYNPLVSDTKVRQAVIVVIDRDAVSARFTQDKYIIAQGGSVTFNDTSIGSVAQWEWEFEGGTPATSSSAVPTVSWSSAGEFGVKLTVRNGKSESSVTKEGTVCVISADKMVVYLPFDGSLNDSGPNGYNATAYSLGGAVSSYASGHDERSSGSIWLPGGNKSKSCVLQLPADSWQGIFGQGSDMTVSMWAKVGPSLAGNTGFFAMGSCPGVLESRNNQIWARMQITNGMMRMLVESWQNSQSNDIQAENIWADGQWHHYVFIYQITSASLCNTYMYIDGVKAGQSVGRAEKRVDTTPFFIGTNMRFTSGAWAPEACMSGYVDDFIIWTRVLDENEIVKLSKY